MWTWILNWPRGCALAAAVTLCWGLSRATAGLPYLPPVAPPPVHDKPPPIHDPPPRPPVSHTPEPATLTLGLIAAGLGGLAARRNRRAA